MGDDVAGISLDVIVQKLATVIQEQSAIQVLQAIQATHERRITDLEGLSWKLVVGICGTFAGTTATAVMMAYQIWGHH